MRKQLVAITMMSVVAVSIAACGNKEVENTTEESTIAEITVETTDESAGELEESLPIDDLEVEFESTETTEEREAENYEFTEVIETKEIESIEGVVNEEEDNEVTTMPTEFTIIELTGTRYAIQTANVRKGPGTNYEKIGSLTTNQAIIVTGRVDGTDWYQFELNGDKVYVSGKFLSKEKVTAETVSEESVVSEEVVMTAKEKAFCNKYGLTSLDDTAFIEDFDLMNKAMTELDFLYVEEDVAAAKAKGLSETDAGYYGVGDYGHEDWTEKYYGKNLYVMLAELEGDELAFIAIIVAGGFTDIKEYEYYMRVTGDGGCANSVAYWQLKEEGVISYP